MYQTNISNNQQQQSKLFIKNNTNSKLLLQNNKKEVFCKLNPKQTSFETYDYEELRNNRYIQIMLTNGTISLVHDRIEEPKIQYQNYGQKYLIGTRCEIVGKHHLVIIIQQYIPQTGQYKAKLEVGGGIMTLSEKEIQPLTPEAIKREEAANKQNNVDIVVNQGVGDNIHTKAKNVKDIMAEAQAELNNVDYDTPQIITISNEKESQQLVQQELAQQEAQQKREQELLRQQYEMEQKQLQASQQQQPNNVVVKNINQNQFQAIAQAPEDNEIEDNIYIVKPNKNTNQKFASEVTTQKMIEDTMSVQNDIIKDIQKEVEQNPKSINKNDQINAIIKNIPQQHQAWFLTFLNKDDRKKKMTINVCRDIEKLQLIIKYCGNYECELAQQRLANLQLKTK